MRFCKLGRLQRLSGTFPLNSLCPASKASTLCKYSRPIGRSPMNLLLLMSKTVALFKSVISSGKQPESTLFDKRISSSVFAILPMLFGIQPWILLFDKTSTETVEFPKFSGMIEWNRLSFKKSASSGLLKSWGGNGPSKSLYLRSRYFRDGNSKTTSGKGPTKRLLLTSSSKRRVSFAMLFGMIPQNLLELRWRRLMSTK